MYNEAEAAYQTVKARSAIVDSFRSIVMDYKTPQSVVDKLLKVIENESFKLNRQDVLEDLIFAGLVYG